jgi:hypothetical protein
MKRPGTFIRRVGPGPVISVTAALALAAGCTVTAPRPPPTTPSRTESTTPAPPDRRSGANVSSAITAYNRFWTIASTLDSQPPDRWRPLLTTVAADPLLTRVLDGLTAQTAAGVHQFGTVRTRPTLVSQTAQLVSIVDCQDASHSGTLDTRTGLPDTAGSPRTPIAASLTRDPNGHWRVTEARYLPGPC